MGTPSDEVLLIPHADWYECRYCGRHFGLPYDKPGWYASLFTEQTLNLVRANARRHALVCWRKHDGTLQSVDSD